MDKYRRKIESAERLMSGAKSEGEMVAVLDEHEIEQVCIHGFILPTACCGWSNKYNRYVRT